MDPLGIVLLHIANKTLREGSIMNRKAVGFDTSLWKLLQTMQPQRLPDGTYRGDAAYFLKQPVQLQLQKFQTTLLEFSTQLGITPLPGEHLTEQFVPRLARAIVTDLQAREVIANTQLIELTPEMVQLIASMDANEIHNLIIETFNLSELPQEIQQEMIDTVGEIVVQGLVIRATEHMTQEQADEFETVLDNAADAEDVLQFIEAIIPDFDQAVVDEIVMVKERMDNDPAEGLSASAPTE